MNDAGAIVAPPDAYIESLKASRNSAVVLKTKLANIRSRSPECIVFAFEGDDDKAVYFQWVRRLRADLTYEPLPCEGKMQVLRFREMLERDRGNLALGVYFFIDRDFDDLRGQALGDRTFMTDFYSVENYLVREEVVDELLKDEFHCHAELATREKLLKLFRDQLGAFLATTADINFRVFMARRLGIDLCSHLPDKVKGLAKVEIDDVKSVAAAEEVVKLAREPEKAERDALAVEFAELDPQSRFRGKFLLAFMVKWLELLSRDRSDNSSALFAGLKSKRVNYSGITIGMLASKSVLPCHLPEFIAAVKFG